MLQRVINKTLTQIFFIVILIICVFPVYFLFSTSLKSEKEWLISKFLPPFSPTLINYYNAIARGGSHFFDWFRNSIIITITATFFTLLLAILIAFILSQVKTKFFRNLLQITVSLMLVPPIVMIIPLFKMINTLRLTDTYLSVIIIYVGLSLPVSIYILTSFFKTIDKEILEASQIDGCSINKTLIKIILPMSSPAIITVIVVDVIFYWAELLIAILFLKSSKVMTLMAAIIVFKTKNVADIPVVMAGLSMMTIPIIILYIFGMKYFIKGLTSGAIKG